MATHSSILAWEMPRTEEPDGPHSMGPIRVGLNPATTNRRISKDHTRVCVCVCVCVYLPLTVLESVSEASWISASVSPDSRPPGLWSGPGLSQVLWLWLRSSRRPAVSHGVGACECVCLSVCLPVVRLLSQEGRVLGGRRGDKGGASVGQRGGAEALRSTAPPWLPVGLGSGQVPGKLGAQDSLSLGPQEVQRPPGRGDREAAGPEDRHLRGRAALSSERDGGGGGGPAQPARPGLEWPGVGGRRDLRTPQPTPQAPRARTHALPVTGGSWKPIGPPGPARRLLVWCWRCSGAGPASAGWSAVAGRAAQVQHGPPRRGAARWPDLQVRAKGRRSARLLGRPAAAAPVSGPIGLKAPDLV